MKTIFTACHSGKLKLAFTSPDVISTSPQNLMKCNRFCNLRGVMLQPMSKLVYREITSAIIYIPAKI